MGWRLWMATAVLFCGTASAQGHFVWIGVLRETGESPIACVWFNESPAPGEARLVDRLRPTEAWLRPSGGKSSSLQLQPQTTGEEGGLISPIDEKTPYAIGARCNYGVFTRGDQSLLLNYYAKHLAINNLAELERVARDEELALDVVPQFSGQTLVLEVLYHGKPTAGLQLVVYPPGGAEQELTTDKQGRVEFIPTSAGLHGFRARYVDAKAAGELKEKKYRGAHYYATLTMQLKPEAKEELSANELLERARDARATWQDFPGFTAKMRLATDEEFATGEIIVSADGDVRLQGFDGIDTKAAQSRLDSLIQHRFAGGGPGEDVEYVDEATEHPLGKLLRFKGDEKLHSAYRVRDDVITEVNRETGPMRFTISVLEIHRNPEGRYLPQAFNVSFWDSASGELKSTETHLNLWTRIDRFDLPQRLLIISGDKQGKRALECKLSDHRLAAPSAGSQ